MMSCRCGILLEGNDEVDDGVEKLLRREGQRSYTFSLYMSRYSPVAFKLSISRPWPLSCKLTPSRPNDY